MDEGSLLGGALGGAPWRGAARACAPLRFGRAAKPFIKTTDEKGRA
jgi:hypothetical protein